MHPSRREEASSLPWRRPPHCLNPRSPCGERRDSTRDPRTGSHFNPRPPLRGATSHHHALLERTAISTHAPLAGSDTPGRCRSGSATHFNPRSPCGERQSPLMSLFSVPRFQSTLPLRGATSHPTMPRMRRLFQSTFPLRGATQTGRFDPCESLFQSTPPLRGATAELDVCFMGL